MRPEYTQEQLSELKQALKDKTNAVYHRKLQAIILYAEGMSLVKAGESTGFVHQTVRNLSNRYLAHGLSAILKEGRGGRRKAYMTLEEEQTFLAKHAEAASEGTHVTAQTMYDDFIETIGHPATRECLYSLLKRHGWRKVSPRPEHPKKADTETIEVSKNKISFPGKV